MTTWASQPAMHPWFSLPSLKRKHSESEQSSEDSDREDAPASSAFSSYNSPSISAQSSLDGREHSYIHGHRDHREWPTPTTKRRRCAIIEHGMAGLNLDRTNNVLLPVETYNEVSSPSGSPPPGPSLLFDGGSAPTIERLPSTGFYANDGMDADIDIGGPSTSAFVLPDAVEEPASPNFHISEVEEIKMKGMSSYEVEKDRIIITDLDSDDDDDEYKQEIEQHPSSDRYADSNADLSISSALLRHLKRNASLPLYDGSVDDIIKKNGAASMALVLFKPPSFAVSEPSNDEEASQENAAVPDMEEMQTEPMVADEDAMDVEL